MTRRAKERFLLALVGSLLAGCESSRVPENLVTVVDFAAEADVAELRHEISLLDFGTPQARPYMVTGWSFFDKADEDQTFVWSSGPRTTLRFFLSRPRSVRTTFRWASFPPPGKEEHRVAIRLNGEDLRTQALEPGWGDYTIDLPESSTLEGLNEIEVLYDDTWALDERGRSEVSVLWDHVRFDGVGVGVGGGNGSESAPPSLRTDPSARALEVPLGTRADYVVEIPKHGVLVIEAVEIPQSPPARLSVSVETDRSPSKVIATWERSLEPRPVFLGNEDTLVARVSFSARSRSDEPAAPEPSGVVRVSGAVLKAPEPDTAAHPAMAPAPAPFARCGPSRPNVLLYLIDTLRADHLGAYGYHRPTSPRIDAFARDGILFRRAIAQSPWTKSSVASIFTGLTPASHQAQDRKDVLPPDIHTAAEIFDRAGYQTGMFYANGWVGKEFDLTRGFAYVRPQPSARSNEIHASFLSWLDERPESGPFFAYLHTIDPHSPYAPPSPHREAFTSRELPAEMGTTDWLRGLHEGRVEPTAEVIDDLIDLYDAEIAHNDATFGELLDALEERGLYQDLYVVLVSDHGEEFFEHGKFEHGNSLYGGLLNVPLIVKLPARCGVAGREVATPVAQVDILPSLLEYLGLDAPSSMDGQSFLSLAASDSGPPAAKREIFSFLNKGGMKAERVTTPDWGFIRNWVEAKTPQLELFTAEDFPSDARNELEARPVRSRYLLDAIERYQASIDDRAVVRTEIDEELTEQLKALGYLR